MINIWYKIPHRSFHLTIPDGASLIQYGPASVEEISKVLRNCGMTVDSDTIVTEICPPSWILTECKLWVTSYEAVTGIFTPSNDQML